MKIFSDNNIPYLYTLFGLNNQIVMCNGREIVADKIKDVDVLLVRSVTSVNQTLLNDGIIQFVGTVTSGVDHIDQNYLKKQGINFTAAPGSNAIAVVEYVFAALLWLMQRDGIFLRDKIVGIVGVGYIGSLLHQRLFDFGVQTLLCDPLLEEVNEQNVKDDDNNRCWKSLETLVSEADILTFHTPLVYDGKYPTWHMINTDVLEALPDNRILINTCRGAVIDNKALLKVLLNGKKLNVVLDVWENEPKLSLSLLSYVDIGTAHIAGYTVESKIRSIVQVYHVYCDYFNYLNNKMTNLSLLFPSVKYNIQIDRKIDELCLSKLIKVIYDIRYDDLLLRRYASTPGGFDKLREYYLLRREWSAICVKSGLDYNNEILGELGFTV